MGLGLQKKKQIIFSYFPKSAMLSIFLYFLLLLFRKHLYPGALSNLPGQTRLYSAARHGGSIQKGIPGNSLAVKQLGLGTFTVEGAGSIPGQGTKIPRDT